jgi:23S rRNA (uridine2552-2'-O)-methyltransferase
MTKPFIIHDPYFEKAKKLGYRARSAFKLLEIEDKYHILKTGQHVLDIAAAPGSFLQVIAKAIGNQ